MSGFKGAPKTHAEDDEWSSDLLTARMPIRFGTTILSHTHRTMPMRRTRISKRGRGPYRGGYRVQNAPEPGQIANNDGGFSFAVSDMKQAERVLILGCAPGANFKPHYSPGVSDLEPLFSNLLQDAEKGPAFVKLLIDIAVSGRALKKDALIHGLALAIKYGTDECKILAYSGLGNVCGTPTMLNLFLESCKQLKIGWGRRRRRMVAKWFSSKDAVSLAYQVTKYQQRDGWSVLDVLRLCHPRSTPGSAAELLYRYIAVGKDMLDPSWKKEGDDDEFVEIEDKDSLAVRSFLCDLVQLKSAETLDNGVDVVVNLMESRLEMRKTDKKVVTFAREHVPTAFLKNPRVWHVLLKNMPLGALLRNLGRLTSLGVIGGHEKSAVSTTSDVVSRLRSSKALRASKIHPFQVFLALKAYEQGHSTGGLTWQPDGFIRLALQEAFYESFSTVEATGKRFFVAVDVSGSMGCPSPISGVTCREAAAVLSMSLMRVEENVTTHIFSNRFARAPYARESSLDDVVSSVGGLPFESTDCSLPMAHALSRRIPVDLFVVITDSETNCNREAPHVVLQKYREASKIDAGLVVVAMKANNVSIADPHDAKMVDVVGLDSSIPELIQTMASF